ncbi:unnamed protein product [Ascophyllum nodosum]
MVSLTFDEFHAIRNRQRAATEAAEAQSRAKPRSERSERGFARRGVAAQPSGPGSDAVRCSDEREQMAPLSGSAPLRPATHNDTHPTCLKKDAAAEAYRKDTVKNKGDVDGPSREHLDQSGTWGGLSASSLGHFVEMFEVQVAVVAMIYVDLVASTAQLLPCMQSEALRGTGSGDGGGGESAGIWVARIVARFMQSLTGFTTVLFAAEIVLLLAAFRQRFFRHLGYVIDMVVVVACLYQELAGLGKEVRLIGALRVWRVARVMNTLLESADQAHAETRHTLRLVEKRTCDLETDRSRLRETLRRELEARRRVEKMLRGYKDEVETLNEALKIAAMDIAKVGVASSDAIEEPKHDGDGDDNGINRKGTQKRDVSSSAAESDANAQNARSGRADKARSSEVGSSGAARVGKTSRSSSSTSPASTNRDTGKIFVFHDGTFQVR